MLTDLHLSASQFILYQTCVECTFFCFPEMRYGVPTGRNRPSCTQKIAKLAAADGAEIWSTPIQLSAGSSISIVKIQQVRRALHTRAAVPL